MLLDSLQGALRVQNVLVLAADGVHGIVRSEVFDQRLCTLLDSNQGGSAHEWSRKRFENAEEMLLALQSGASRPLNAYQATPLLQRDPAAVWKQALLVSVLIKALLAFWLSFLPR